jgi:hypothetical protein
MLPAAGEIVHHLWIAVQIEQVVYVIFGELAQGQSLCFQDDVHVTIIRVLAGLLPSFS